MSGVAEIMAVLARLENKIDALAARKAAPATIPDGGAVASEKDLDSQYGDPSIKKKDPPRWDGPSFVGKKYSECSPEYLDCLAGFLDWKAEKDAEKGTEDGNKYAGYARKDAARARGWAKRKRDGWKPAPTSNAALFGGGGDDFGPPPDDDIPFSSASPRVSLPLDRWRGIF